MSNTVLKISEKIYMIRMYILKNINTFYIMAAFVHFFITLFTDRFIFEYEEIDISKLIRIKFLFLVFLIVIWQIIGYVVKTYRTNNWLASYLKFTFIYFDLMLVALLCIMPGNLKNHADFFYLANTMVLQKSIFFEPILMDYFRIFSMMLFPCMSGIVIGHLLVISLVVGYIITKFNIYFKFSKAVFLLYVPFLMLLVIENNLFIDTCIIYSYLILFLLAFLFFMHEEKKPITAVNIIILSLTIAVLSHIRAEGVIFIVFAPLIFLILNYSWIKKKYLFFFFLFLLTAVTILPPKYVYTSFGGEEKVRNLYPKLYRLYNGFKITLEEAVRSKDSKIIAELNSVVDVGYLLSPDTKITLSFYSKLSEKQKKKFDIVSKELFKKYRDTYIKYKIYDSLFISPNHAIFKLHIKNKNFFQGNPGAFDAYNRIYDKLMLYRNDTRIYFADFLRENSSARYSLIFPVCIVFFSIILSFLFRKKSIILLSSLMLVHFFAVAIMAPYGAFRFNFNMYLYGYLLLTIICVSLILKLGKNKKQII